MQSQPLSHGAVRLIRRTIAPAVFLLTVVIDTNTIGLVSASQGAVPVGSDVSERHGILECSSDRLSIHNPDLVEVSGELRCFEGYLSDFDVGVVRVDDELRSRAIPNWVVQWVKPVTPESTIAEGRERPRTWYTIPDLAVKNRAPTDRSYQFSKSFRNRNANWYERGHLAQKHLVERLRGTAAWFTHNMANAVPQRGRFNKNTWLALECFTGAWANKYGGVWIISGPIFLLDRPSSWLTSDKYPKAIPVAIPDALFKVVIRKDKDRQKHVLAFVLPQEDQSYFEGDNNPSRWLTSVHRVEELSDEKILTNFDTHLRKEIASKLWSVSETHFDPSCRRFAKEIK